MTEEILKYIRNEKDISRYKISLLEKRTNKEYKYRLISIEKDFVEYPFEKIGFEDLGDLKEAIVLFKTNRKQFEETFSKDTVVKTRVVSEKQIDVLKKKIKYYEDLYKYLLDIKIKEINLLQNDYIKSKLKKTDDTPLSGLDAMAEAEGVSLAKKRARIQILIYCLSRFVFHKTQELKMLVKSDKLSFNTYDFIRRSLDNFFEDIKYNFFKHYNSGIKEVPLLINGTLGHNNFVNTIYPLVNLIDKHPSKYCIKRVLSEDKAFFKKNKAPVNKQGVKRGFAILTPMGRTGNESINLLYLDLWTENGISINNIMEKEFFNYNSGDEYIKAVSTKPVWTFGSCIDNKFLLREALALLDLDKESMVDEINFEDKHTIDKINNSNKGSIYICIKSSKILIPATRSESEHIRESCIWVDLLIKEIKDDYKSLFNPITLEDKDREDRKKKVEEFIE